MPYGRHHLDQQDIDAVVEVLKSDWLTTGPKIEEFEKTLNQYIGSKNAIAVNSGTSALDIAVAALELPAKSEIITTPLTFAASANCALYNNCVPIFADIQADTFNIDPTEIEKKINKKTKAIIYVDYAGLPCDIKQLREIADSKDIYLIEDAAHALGAEYNRKRTGTFADITEFSFHPVKHITTGEGGALTTENEEIAQKLRLLRTHGIDRSARERFGPDAGYAYDMKMLGRNYRITDIQCALGISQMKKIDRFLQRRKEIARKYTKLLREFLPQVRIQHIPDDRESAWHLFVVLVPNRDKVFNLMRKKGILVNVHYIPTYKFSYYRTNFKIEDKDYPNTERVYAGLLSLPIYYDLNDEDIEFVVRSLGECIKEAKS
ncbi:UDP-4-amino-4,6-dideoxy-N-acetyl-beta-L-altrosamine transaminase [Candidatus Micrarchaeota archaeon]|nr:UDP-4-amino-4,6-dideoxy-N-acetyl-beta-L-altrosamine transaminase [Candidatus Micrarchaeota archaeon]